MRKDRPSPAQQGDGDGLCGIYALINFLRNEDFLKEKDQSSTDRECFNFLMEAAESLGYLTAHNLFGGFVWPKLERAFNLACETWRAPFLALPLSVVAENLKTDRIEDVAAACVKEGGAIVAHMDKQDHWILVYDCDEISVWVDDSSVADEEKNDPANWPNRKIDKNELRRGFGIKTNSGVVLLPTTSKLARLKNQNRLESL